MHAYAPGARLAKLFQAHRRSHAMLLVLLFGCEGVEEPPPPELAGGGSPGRSLLAISNSPPSPALNEPTGDRAPVTTPLTNVGGMWSSSMQPTNRSSYLAVTPDGSKVAVSWLHNQDVNGAFSTSGEPITYATIGDPANPSSFTSAQLVGRRMFAYVHPLRTKYNSAHNHPWVAATNAGGFLGLSVPMNANGWAQGMSQTSYGYHESSVQPGGTAWTTPALAPLRYSSQGSSVTETHGGFDGNGNLHMFGQGRLGQAQGGFAYHRRASGDTMFDIKSLAAAYRSSGLYYFSQGGAFVSHVRNASGHYDIHTAFAWLKQGAAPMYGLSYLKSSDGGKTWRNASGATPSLPLQAHDNQAAVVPANLGSSSYSGNIPGVHGISVAASGDVPVIVRLNFDSSQSNTQATVYTHANGGWKTVPVGPLLHWNAGGTGVSVNEATGRVNVVLLDAGSASAPGRILLYHQPLSDLMAGKANWTQEVVASVPNGSRAASSLKVAVVPNKRFVVMFEPNYVNPGRVKPVLLEAPMR